ALRGGQPAGAGGVVNLRHGESLGYRWRLARVLGVDLDVGVGQVGGPDGGLTVAAGEVDLDVDVLTREVNLAGVRGSGGVDADVVAVEGHSDLCRVHGYRGHADGGEHAAPVRVGAEHRALEEVVATDDAGGGLGLLVGGGAGDGDRDLLGHALGVALQLAGEVQADLVDRAGELGGVRPHTGGTVGEHDEGVVGGGGAVHVDAVEGDPAGCPHRLLGGFCAGQLNVGGEEDQHRGQGWGHHAHALGHRADAPAIALVDRLLDDGIRGHDRLGGLGAGREVGGELGGQCRDSRLDLVHRQQVAYQAGGAHGHVCGVDAERIANEFAGALGVLHALLPRAGVRVASVDDGCAESSVVQRLGQLHGRGLDLVAGEQRGGVVVGAVVDQQGHVRVAGGLDARGNACSAEASRGGDAGTLSGCWVELFGLDDHCLLIFYFFIGVDFESC